MGQDQMDWRIIANGQQYELKGTHISQTCLKDTQ